MSSPNASDGLLQFLRKSYPSAIPESSSEDSIQSLSGHIFPDSKYTDSEKVEISQWLTTSSRLATPGEDQAKHAERLGSLNTHLSTRTTLLGSKPSVADIALYYRLAPAVQSWTAEERTGERGYRYIVRLIDFVQNAPLFRVALKPDEKVQVNVDEIKFVPAPIDPKEEKERKKKGKAAAADAQVALPVGKSRVENADKSNKKEKAKNTTEGVQEKVKGAVTNEDAPQAKKEKKEKPQKQKQVAKETPLSPSLIDLRVGHILKAINHPNADSLYVSTIACGDPPGTDNTSEYDGQIVRTVCSGLNGLVPLEEMQGRKIIAVCNLKPVTMRGIKSAAMVLAASPRLAEGEQDNHAGPVELVSPPAEAQAGERVMFEGWAGGPEEVLNPKKKVWEMLQPGFTTSQELEVGFDMSAVPQLQSEGEIKDVSKLKTAAGGVCTVKSLRGATVR